MDSGHSHPSEMLSMLATALEQCEQFVDDEFEKAIALLADLTAIFVVTGLGKSGLIGKKAAATFSSTGTRAVFVHPVEALHGDLGIVESGAVMLALSKSGLNEETIEFTKQFQKTVSNGRVITMTEQHSQLEANADIKLHIPTLPEIDRWDLAPTTSSLTTMAMCDVLAISVQQRKGLSATDFAQFHPSGTLGRRLLLRVQDLMIESENLPIQPLTATSSEVLTEASSRGFGLVLLTHANGEYFGMLTDGDIRRLIERDEPVSSMTAEECFHASRRGRDLPSVQRGFISGETKAVDCLREMEKYQITSMVVLNDNRPHGLVRMQDLIAAGL